MYHPQIVKIHGWNQKAVDVFRFFIHCMSLHLYGGTWGSLRVVSLHPMDLHWEIRCNFCPPTIAIQWSMIWFIQGNHFLHKQNGPSAIKWKDKCKCHSIKACKFGREHVQSARKRYILQKPPSLANNSFWTLLFSGGGNKSQYLVGWGLVTLRGTLPKCAIVNVLQAEENTCSEYICTSGSKFYKQNIAVCTTYTTEHKIFDIHHGTHCCAGIASSV